MNSFQKVLAGVLLASGCACALAQSLGGSTPIPMNQNGPNPMPSSGDVLLTNAPTSFTGTILRKQLTWNSNIPLNKTWEQLTPEQKAQLISLYESMAPGDEPPFPIDGIRPVFNSIAKGQRIVRARGTLNMVVNVSPEGKALEVIDLGGVAGPNAREMTQFAQSVLLMTKFKPAVCAGKPCKSQFPFQLALQLN